MEHATAGWRLRSERGTIQEMSPHEIVRETELLAELHTDRAMPFVTYDGVDAAERASLAADRLTRDHVATAPIAQAHSMPFSV